MRENVSALTLKFREKLPTKELFQQRSTLKRKNENVVEIGIREANLKTFNRTIVIHKNDKAMSNSTLNQHDDCSRPAICKFQSKLI